MHTVDIMAIYSTLTDYQYVLAWVFRKIHVLPILWFVTMVIAQISYESSVRKGQFFSDDSVLVCRKIITLTKPSRLTCAAVCFHHEYCPDQCEGFMYDAELSVCHLCLSCQTGDPQPSNISSHHFKTCHDLKNGEFTHCH